MITKEVFNKLKEKYGNVSSWAIWVPQGNGQMRDNVGNIDFFNNYETLEFLNNDYVFIGLNASKAYEKGKEWSMFHSGASRHHDNRLRHALMNTKFWGAYMTDFFKSYNEPNSSEVNDRVKKSPDFLETNMNNLYEELNDLGGEPILIAMGTSAFKYLKKFAKEFDIPKERIKKITHYSYMNIGNQEAYRQKVLKELSNII